MKKTMIKTAIAVAIAAVMGAASAATITAESGKTYEGAVLGSGDVFQGTGSEDVTFHGIKSDSFAASNANGTTTTIKDINDLTLSGKRGNDGSVFYTNGAGSKLDISLNGDLTSSGDIAGSKVFHAMGGTIDLNVKGDIRIEGAGNAVYAQKNGAGAESAINIHADGDIFLSTNTGAAVSAYSLNTSDDGGYKSTVTITSGKSVTIESQGTAVSAGGSDWKTGEDVSNNNTVSITAADKITLSGANAVLATNGESSSQKAGVVLSAKTIESTGAIKADTNAAITIGGNEGFDKAIINGDVTVAVGSSVDMSLGNAGSFTGAVNRDVGAETPTSTANIDLGTNSTWNVTGASSVTNVNGTGSMNLASKEATVTIDKLNGNVNAGFEKLTADDFANAEELGKMVQAEAVTGNATLTTYAAEGNIRGAMTVTQDVNGTNSYVADNTKLESFKGVNASALVQWRNQINHLTKRLGDVRHQSGDIGAWTRVYGGEYKWGDMNRVDMQTTTVQVGGDARVGDWIVGGAFSYSDSSYDLDNGEGDGDLYSLAVYGTRMFEKGSYVDFVARYGYIKNDLQAGNMDVDFDSNAFSLSVEGGHTYKFMERAYVEPQIEVTYGFAQGDDATASNGVKIEQDDYQNLVTRIGFRTGFDFPKNAGTIYAHASYSYDFLGEADGTASQDGLHASLDEDLGGGWVTYGIGGQFRLGESTFAYGELERSTGGDVDNPWAFNVGMRHLF